MQKSSIWEIFVRLILFHRAVLRRVSEYLRTSDASASPFLVFVASTLSVILAILEIDPHREELKALGIVFGDDAMPPQLLGP